jgi:hypothetical protein
VCKEDVCAGACGRQVWLRAGLQKHNFSGVKGIAPAHVSSKAKHETGDPPHGKTDEVQIFADVNMFFTVSIR